MCGLELGKSMCSLCLMIVIELFESSRGGGSITHAGQEGLGFDHFSQLISIIVVGDSDFCVFPRRSQSRGEDNKDICRSHED